MALGKFGRYEIKSEIGRGGMATVYYAYDPNFEREVAIKVLPPEFLHDPQFRVRFEREAKMVALIEHPAIVPVYDFGEESGQPFIVMRYMSGGSLADKLKNGPLPIPQVTQLLSVLAPALDAAHAKGIIHRDLKPGNILFDQYDNPYLSDFGIARLTNAANATLTGAVIVGTPAYMSPEQIQGDKALDGRSDIYALGVILFQMLTGVMPYQADTPAKMMMAHLLEPIPPIHTANQSLPPAMDVVVDQAMAKDPTQRFQSASEMATMLQAVASGKVIAPSEQTRLSLSPLSAPPRTGPGFPTPTPPPASLARPITGEPEAKKRSGLPVWAWILGGMVILGLLGVVVLGGGVALYAALARNHAAPTATLVAGLASNPSDTPTPEIAMTPTAGLSTPTSTAPVAPTDTPVASAGQPTAEVTPAAEKNVITVESFATGLQTLISYQTDFKYEVSGKNSQGSQEDDTLEINTKKITASGDYYYHMGGSALMADSGGLEMYSVDKVLYMFQNTPGGTPTCLNMSTLGGGASSISEVEPEAFIGSITNAVLVAKGETVNTVSADHYRLDRSSVHYGTYKSASGDLWIAEDGGYVVKLHMQATGQATITGQMIDGTITWDYNTTQINQLDAITLPPECQGKS